MIIASVVLNALCFTAGVWELKQRKTAALSARAASFRDIRARKARAFRNVGMTTETFSNRLKSHRKAEAFRRRVIKMKQGRGGSKRRTECAEQNSTVIKTKRSVIKAARKKRSERRLQTGSGTEKGSSKSCVVEASHGSSH